MKTLHISFIITGLLFTCLVFTACEKMIAVKMPYNQIDKNQVFDNLQTTNAAMAGLYAGLQKSFPLAGGSSGSGAALSIYTDDMDYFATTYPPGYEMYLNKQIETNGLVESFWSNCYQHIYKTNDIIVGMENAKTIAENDKKRIKGEAILIRSINYFYLQQVFGDIPYTTTTTYQVNHSISKTAAPEMLTKLVEDLTEAVALLNDDYGRPERVMPNRKVAELMLAKIYLLQQKWDKAETILKTIIQSPLYQFQNDITQVFKKTGKHILWQLRPLTEGAATKEAESYYVNNAVPTSYALTENLMSIFSDNDLRKKSWMLLTTFNGKSWYLPWKYQVRSNNTSEYSIVFRLEEVYLLLAEALAQQNIPDKTTEAMLYVNAIKGRADIPVLSGQLTKDELLDEIMEENRREFFAEMGHRFLDLKRLDRFNTLVPAKPNWKEYHKLWPLPQKELLLNTGLRPQNTGY